MLENGDYNIILVETYPCNSKDELLARERYWSDKIVCVNKCKAGLYNELGHVQYHRQYDKQYRDSNKAKRSELYPCECGGCYTYTHKSQHMNTTRHMEYEKHKLFYLIRHGLDMIKQQLLDDHFATVI
jgi:hypothetical protein